MTPPDAQPTAARPFVVVLEREGGARSPLWSDLARSFEIAFARTEDEARAAVTGRQVALVVLDDLDLAAATAAKERLAAAGTHAPVVLLRNAGDEDEAVETLRRGFTDYIVKRGENVRADLLAPRLGRSLEVARLQRENESLHQAIEESQARLFSVYDSLDDVIMQIDDECRVHSLNRSAAALANIEPKQGVGATCHQLFDFYPCRQRQDKESCHIYRTFLEGETIRGERKDPKTGDVHQYMTFITTLKDHDYVVYRETDITEKRRLEEKIAAALRSLGANPDAGEER